MSVQSPLLDKLTPYERSDYQAFFDKNHALYISKYSAGSSLTHLVYLANQVQDMLGKINPICNTSTFLGKYDDPGFMSARQWHIDRISEIKRTVAQAMEYKRTYYDSHWLGILTQFVLKCLGKWNDGNTSSIRKAEDFLTYWDSRYPVFANNNLYRERCFFPLELAIFVRRDYNLSTFYNYTPSRIIPLENGGTFQAAVAQWVV